MLSPSQRQVAHALLTRPPLSSKSIDRSLNHWIPVRLECVMLAASVHPEPGSNSLKNYFTILGIANIFFRACLLFLLSLFFGYHWSIINVYSWNLRVTLHLMPIFRQAPSSLCFLVFRCSIFKVRYHPLSRTALLLYHTHFPLSRPFLKFLKKYLTQFFVRYAVFSAARL